MLVGRSGAAGPDKSVGQRQLECETSKLAAGDMEFAYAKSVDEVLEYFSVKETDGLSADEVEKQRQKFGLNG